MDINALEERIAFLERELERLTEKYEGMSAEDMYKRTRTYIENNPVVWEKVKQDARRCAEQGEPFSIAKEFEELRLGNWLIDHESEDYRCNNSFRACMTRFLLLEVPQVKPYVKLRKSKIDKYFPGLWEKVA